MTSGVELDRAMLVPIVCERLATGKESLTKICESLGFQRNTFNVWRREDPEIDKLAEAARQEWCESLEEDFLSIADDDATDIGIDVDGAPLFDTGRVQRAKLRMYARERLLKAYLPTRWSERQQIDHKSSDGSMTPKGLGDFYASLPTPDPDVGADT